MKFSTILILMAVACTNYASAQTRQMGIASTAQTSAEDEIKNLEEARNQAVQHGDVAELDRMTSDDYTFITLRGEMRTKSDILKGFASGSFDYESRQIPDLKVRVLREHRDCNWAFDSEGMENGKDYSGDYRFTRVYVKQKGPLADCSATDNLDSAMSGELESTKPARQAVNNP